MKPQEQGAHGRGGGLPWNISGTINSFSANAFDIKSVCGVWMFPCTLIYMDVSGYWYFWNIFTDLERDRQMLRWLVNFDTIELFEDVVSMFKKIFIVSFFKRLIYCCLREV